MSSGLQIPRDGALDFLSLGALVHRLDPETVDPEEHRGQEEDGVLVVPRAGGDAVSRGAAAHHVR